MINEITDDIKREASSGISQIIGKVFSTLFEPLLKGIDAIKTFFKKRYDERKMRNTMSFVVNYNLLQAYLDKHNFDCIMHTTHNGLCSEGGFEYKYIKPIFTFIQAKNEMLEIFCNNSSPIQLYIQWICYCIQHKTFTKNSFDEKMMVFFGDYDRIFWRRHRSVFYCILSGDAILTNENEKYINTIIDKFLQK